MQAATSCLSVGLLDPKHYMQKDVVVNYDLNEHCFDMSVG